jgi:hypothetical protein
LAIERQPPPAFFESLFHVLVVANAALEEIVVRENEQLAGDRSSVIPWRFQGDERSTP